MSLNTLIYLKRTEFRKTICKYQNEIKNKDKQLILYKGHFKISIKMKYFLKNFINSAQSYINISAQFLIFD